MILLFVLACVLATIVVTAWRTLACGTYVTKFGVVRSISPARHHYIADGALFVPNAPTHEVEVEIDGTLHRCWTHKTWEIGQSVRVGGVQNKKWSALKIEQ